jgi:hypothetical protein
MERKPPGSWSMNHDHRLIEWNCSKGAPVWIVSLSLLIALAVNAPAAARTIAPYRYADERTILLGEFYRPSEAALAGAEWYKLRMRHCPVRILCQTFVVGSKGYSFAVTYVPSRRCT